MIAAAPGLNVPLEVRIRLADLYCAYDDALNNGELELWPPLFTEACVYKVLPRENHERDFPVAVIYCESRAMLEDRVTALRETSLYAPRVVRRFTSGICLRTSNDREWSLTANFMLLETLSNKPSTVLLCGRTLDKVVEEDSTLRFAERICVYDSTIVPASLVYPV